MCIFHKVQEVVPLAKTGESRILTLHLVSFSDWINYDHNEFVSLLGLKDLPCALLHFWNLLFTTNNHFISTHHLLNSSTLNSILRLEVPCLAAQGNSNKISVYLCTWIIETYIKIVKWEGDHLPWKIVYSQWIIT